MFLSGRYCQQSAIYQRGLKVLSIAVANGRKNNSVRHWNKKKKRGNIFHIGSPLPLVKTNRIESTGSTFS
jgi:hypothetical protein